MKRLYLLIVIVPFITLLAQCEDQRENSNCLSKESNSPSENIARRQCSSCHLFPTPDLLDKKSWTSGVLPDMGRRLGVQSENYDPFKDVFPDELKIIKKLNVYPDSSMISEDDWDSIVNYYSSMAPDSLPGQDVTTIVADLPPPFQVNEIDIEGKPVPQVTLLHYDSLTSDLYIGDNEFLYVLDQEGVITSSWQMTSPAVDLNFDQNRVRHLLNIGHFRPSDLKLGTFSELGNGLNNKGNPVLINRLPRPVSFTTGDLNNDQKEDVIICGFGHHTGELVWFDDYDTKNVLSSLPGARKTIIRDLNGDQLPDIIALMAQAWEGVDVYYNSGDGTFSRERVLEFPAVHGVSYMDMADFNSDGYEDLIITNGDNWDYSTVKKPYHGIRIYLNSGQNKFEEKYFYPMYGCSKAVTLDFDNDGDLDIAAISFYDNIDQPAKSFVYLENTGSLTFSAQYLSEAANGKWLTMEAGDFNQDGRMDLFLGSYFHNVGELTKLLSKGVEEFPEVLLLLNSSQ